MQSIVAASTALQAGGLYSVYLAMHDRHLGTRTLMVGSYADAGRARHMGHIITAYLREVLSREPLIDKRHIDDAQRYAESHRTA